MQRKLLFLLCFLVSISSAVRAQDLSDPVAIFDEKKVWYTGYAETWFYFSAIPESEVRQSIVRWEDIARDLKTSSGGLTGTYVAGGSTHGEYLRWSFSKGFVWLSVNKCTGGPTRIRLGRVEQFPGGIRLITQEEFGSAEGHGDHEQHGPVSELVTIGWMGADYLISKRELPSFADYVGGFGEFNNSMGWIEGAPFLFRSKYSADQAEPKFEMPVYPRGYDGFSKRPVRGTVRQILSTRNQRPDGRLTQS